MSNYSRAKVLSSPTREKWHIHPTSLHQCTNNAPTHAWPTLPVKPNTNPVLTQPRGIGTTLYCCSLLPPIWPIFEADKGRTNKMIQGCFGINPERMQKYLRLYQVFPVGSEFIKKYSIFKCQRWMVEDGSWSWAKPES